MDFIDWRKSSHKVQLTQDEQAQIAANRYRRKMKGDYVEEAIREAQARGEFDNLRGMGKPLNLDDHFAAGENSMAYGLLKSNNFVPPELEIAKEIDARKEEVERKLGRLMHWGRTLCLRRVPPSIREKRAYNSAVEKALPEYERDLRSINSRILTLNISAPEALHRTPLNIEEQIRHFQVECPLFQL